MALSGSLSLSHRSCSIISPFEGFDLPTFEVEDPQENFKLALLWDARGLLRLLPSLPDDQAYRHTCRIFNAFKAADRDRQIGDRRIANASERHVPGPSKWLPQGQLLVGLQVARFREQITAYVSDRKDFYHQVEITGAEHVKPPALPTPWTPSVEPRPTMTSWPCRLPRALARAPARELGTSSQLAMPQLPFVSCLLDSLARGFLLPSSADARWLSLANAGVQHAVRQPRSVAGAKVSQSVAKSASLNGD